MRGVGVYRSRVPDPDQEQVGNGRGLQSAVRECTPLSTPSGQASLMWRSAGVVSLLLGSILLVSGAWNLNGQEDKEAPGVTPVIDAQTFDFGLRFVGEVIEHNFTVENPFDHALTISGVSSSCGCTVPGEVPDRIPARSSIQIPVTVRLDKPMDEFGQSVTLMIARHPVRLGVEGRVVYELPPTVDFGTFRGGDAPTREVLLRSRPGRVVTVMGIINADELYFTVGEGPSRELTAGTFITLTVKPDVRGGPFEREIIIMTDDEDAPHKAMTIRGYVLREVEMEPRSPLSLGVIDAHGEQSVTVRLYSPSGEGVTVARVEVSPPQFLRWERGGGGDGVPEDAVAVVLILSGNFESQVMKASALIHAAAGDRVHLVPVVLYAMRSGSSIEQSE